MSSHYSESKSKLDQANLRSEEVQEILGTPPHWLLRWGMLLSFIFIIILAWSLYWFSFPETVKAKIRLTKEDPPINLIVESSTYITDILVQSEDTVVAGQTVFVLDSEAKFEDVLSLDDYLLTLEGAEDSVLLNKKFPPDLRVGEIEENLLAFIEKQDQAKEEQSGRFSQMSATDLRIEIRQEKRYIAAVRNRRNNLEGQLELARIAFTRQDNLYKRGRGDFNRLREAEGRKFELESQIQEASTTIKIKQSRIRLLEQRLKTNASISEGSRIKSMNDLVNALDALQRAVERWKRKHLLVSPIDGIVILDQVKVQKYVQTDERIAVVVPVSSSKLIGRSLLPLDKSGQIEKKQKVIVDFYSFPAKQFGAVEGIVAAKSKIPTANNMLPIEIRFPKGLITTTGKKLEIGQDMRGDITIIIEEKRLIQWLIDRF